MEESNLNSIDTSDYTYKDGNVVNANEEVIISDKEISSKGLQLDESGNLIDEAGNAKLPMGDWISKVISSDKLTYADLLKGNIDAEDDSTTKPDPSDYTYSKEDGYKDKEGSIILSKSKIEELLSADESLNLDTEGNLVDTSGSIVKSKDDIIEELLSGTVSDDDDEGLTVESVAKLAGVPITEGVTYEPGVEGLVKFIKNTVDNVSNAKRSDVITSVFSEHPEIVGILRHKLTYGSIDGYFRNSIDVDKVTLSHDSDKDTLRNIVELYEHTKNPELSSEQITREVDDLIDLWETKGDDVFYNKTLERLSALKELKSKRDKALSDKMVAQQADLDKQEEEYYNSISKKVLEDKLIKVGDSEFSLPSVLQRRSEDGKTVPASLNEFFQYYIKPAYKDTKGNKYSTFMKDFLNLSVDEKLKLALELFTGSNDVLVNHKVNKKTIDLLKQTKSANVFTTPKTGSSNPLTRSKDTIKKN